MAISSSPKNAEDFCLNADTSDNFVFSEISVSTVAEQLFMLDFHIATGPDGLSGKYLKEIDDVVAPHLTALYNESLRDGIAVFHLHGIRPISAQFIKEVV